MQRAEGGLRNLKGPDGGFSADFLRAAAEGHFTFLKSIRIEQGGLLNGAWALVCILGPWKEPSVLSTGLYPYCMLTSNIMHEFPAGSLFLPLSSDFQSGFAGGNGNGGSRTTKIPSANRGTLICALYLPRFAWAYAVKKCLCGLWKPFTCSALSEVHTGDGRPSEVKVTQSFRRVVKGSRASLGV